MWKFCGYVLLFSLGSNAWAVPVLIESTPLSAYSVNPGTTLFEVMPAGRTGVNVHSKPIRLTGTGATKFNTDSPDFDGTIAGGVAIGDYDGDGKPDLYLSLASKSQRLYRGLGEFRFEDVTGNAGIQGDGLWAMGGSWADVDNDGDLDLYVCVSEGVNRLYVNQGDGTFKEEAKAAGLDYAGPSVMMAFADYDLDGDLDAYLLTNRSRTRRLPKNNEVRVDYIEGKPVIQEEYRELLNVLIGPKKDTAPLVQGGAFDHLYRNNGDGSFEIVDHEAGIGGNFMGLSATWWDYNNDGRPDLYVANDFTGPDQLYRNDGNGRFTDVIKTAIPHTPWFSMGADFADINNDGRLDFMATDMSGTDHYSQKVAMGDMVEDAWFLSFPWPRQYMRNALYLNSGTDRFQEVAYLCGLASTDWTWSPIFGDLDNDGWVDLYVSNGMSRDFYNSDIRNRMKSFNTQKEVDAFVAGQPTKSDLNVACRNLGGLRFERIEKVWGLDDRNVSFGVVEADLDSDGDLDLVVNNYEGTVSVYRNHTEGHRIIIRLQGRASNRFGIGARVELESALGSQVRYLSLAHGYMSSSVPELHFGLGRDPTIDKLTVLWPSGIRQVFRGLDVDCLYTITEPEPVVGEPDPPAEVLPEPLFGPSDALKSARHTERPFDDFARQPLLPNKLSQLGPGIACADIDGDGDDDFYIGGAAGVPGRLYFNDGKGNFKPKSLRIFDMAHASEDMAALFFDADADGDADLYVVSGGVECEAGDARLTDRLYLNEGKGYFLLSSGALPDLRDSGSVVAAADYDQDGDLDLFVGARSIPGQYPLPPSSRILRNSKGKFEEVTDLVAPDLKEGGLVTSALWTHVDSDEWIDLMITYEWGAVAIWKNEKGDFSNHTESAGLSTLTGWWNSIAGGDFDHDGDTDYVVGNVGLNTKYTASHEHPMHLYYGDFGLSGKSCLVEAQFEDEALFPVRGKSCSQNAMPFVGEKFKTFHDFASASLETIYSKEGLQKSYHLEANGLESGVLINDGSGHFSFSPLPRIAQAAPGYGVVVADLDADSHLDIYMVQNSYSPQPETGHMDGGLSLLLKGNGDGSFAPVDVLQSGLLVAGDAKGLSVTDLNKDGWPDLVATVNNGFTTAFIHNTVKGRGMLEVGLQGPKGNPTGVGARVVLHSTSGPPQRAEISAGGGYLSQSTAKLYFAVEKGRQPDRLEVRWPDGTLQKSPVAEHSRITIRHPDL
jgi:hypothetical protein